MITSGIFFPKGNIYKALLKNQFSRRGAEFAEKYILHASANFAPLRDNLDSSQLTGVRPLLSWSPQFPLMKFLTCKFLQGDLMFEI